MIHTIDKKVVGVFVRFFVRHPVLNNAVGPHVVMNVAPGCPRRGEEMPIKFRLVLPLQEAKLIFLFHP
jgi:hypothetical protein